MSKNFFDIFREAFGPREEKKEPEEFVDEEGYTHLTLEIEDEHVALVTYIFKNDGALRERDRIKEALRKVDAPWVTYALEEIDKIPRNLPKEGEESEE